MQNNTTHEIDTNLLRELSSEERQVYKLLKNKENQKYPLGAWYLGAMHTIRDITNPDRYSQAAHSMREVFEKLSKINEIQEKIPDLKQKRKAFTESLLKAKEECPEWEGQITTQLKNSLQAIEEYIKLNETPSRAERIANTLKQKDPLAYLLPNSTESSYRKIWKGFENITHHNMKKDIDLSFEKTLHLFNKMIIDNFAPTIAENQQEIRAILGKKQITTEDEKQMLELLLKKGANLKFLLENADNACWFFFLQKNNLLNSTQDPNHLWRIVQFLNKIIDQAPLEILEYLNKIQPDLDSLHTSTLFHIANLSTKISDLSISYQYKEHIKNYIKSNDPFSVDEILSSLSVTWSVEKEGFENILELLELALSPHQIQDKQGLSYNPKTYLSEWEYSNLIDKVVLPLGYKKPIEISNLLMDILNNLFSTEIMRFGNSNYDEGSIIWCKKITGVLNEYENSNPNFLANALACICKEIYQKHPEYIATLDKKLREIPYKFFTRLRLYLYSQFPNKQTMPWISAYLLDYPNYDKKYGYEVQICIKVACDTFKKQLLTSQQLESITNKILQDTSEEKEVFCYMQLRPFYSILPSKIKKYYESISNKYDLNISDDDYLPIRYTQGGFIQEESPKSCQELELMSDSEILKFLNDWDSPTSWFDSRNDNFNKKGVFIEITVYALHKEFGVFFEKNILGDKKRLYWWVKNILKIKNPLFYRAFLKCFIDELEKQNMTNIDNTFNISNFIASQIQQNELGYATNSLYAKHRDQWHDIMREVIKYLQILLNKTNFAYNYLDKVSSLFKIVYLDISTIPCPQDTEDHYLNALYKFRENFLEVILRFTIKLHKDKKSQDLESLLDILKEGLEKRHNDNSLTLSEYSIWGSNIFYVLKSYKDWSEEVLNIVFPDDNLEAWTVSINGYLLYGAKGDMDFPFLQKELEKAVAQTVFWIEDKKKEELVRALGQNLFYNYLTNYFQLNDKKNLLKTYYKNINKSKEISYLNFMLEDLGRMFYWDNKLSPNEIARAKEFINWRIEEGNSSELQKFYYWLEYKDFGIEWQLEQVLYILKKYKLEKDNVMSYIYALCDIYPNYKNIKILDCIHIILNNFDTKSYIYLGEVKAVLDDATVDNDENIQNKAKEIMDRILALGLSFN